MKNLVKYPNIGNFFKICGQKSLVYLISPKVLKISFWNFIFEKSVQSGNSKKKLFPCRIRWEILFILLSSIYTFNGISISFFIIRSRFKLILTPLNVSFDSRYSKYFSNPVPLKILGTPGNMRFSRCLPSAILKKIIFGRHPNFKKNDFIAYSVLLTPIKVLKKHGWQNHYGGRVWYASLRSIYCVILFSTAGKILLHLKKVS